MQYTQNIEIKEKYDLIVCGGGFSGFAAAYSAAREGLKVIIIEKTGALGGVGTNGLVNHILGERYLDGKEIKACIGGLFAQMEKELLENGGATDIKDIDMEMPPQGWYAGLGIGLIFDKEKMKLLLEDMLSRVGAKILYMTDIIDVFKDGNEIKGVIVHNKSGLYGIEGKYFADATGDADICTMAGVEAQKGDEEGGMAAASLEMHLENVDWGELTRFARLVSTAHLQIR